MERRSLPERRRALIIAISQYNDQLKNLPFCKNDGEELYKILTSIGYQISDGNKLIGQVKGEQIKNSIYDFFGGESINSQDTNFLLFWTWSTRH